MSAICGATALSESFSPSDIDSSAMAGDAMGASVHVNRIPNMATSKMLNDLPKLDDDELRGVLTQHVVPRDDAPDLTFKGTLIASAAPEYVEVMSRERWNELRVYETAGGSHIFSHIGRSAKQGERDKCSAEIYDPTQLAPFEPKTWNKAALKYFQYTDLAKKLYRELGIAYEERVD